MEHSNINWADDCIIYETIYELRGSIAATYGRAAAKESIKKEPLSSRVEYFKLKMLEIPESVIQNLHFATRIEAQDYITYLRNLLIIAQKETSMDLFDLN